jgi:DNA-binding XRE family transcriptional regulator
MSGIRTGKFGDEPNRTTHVLHQFEGRSLTGTPPVRSRRGDTVVLGPPMSHDPLDAFAANLVRRRRALGLTQEAVAADAMMDQSQYSRIERARVDPSVRTLVRVARALRTTPGELLAGVRARPD